MSTMTYTSQTNEQKTFYNRTLLERLTPNLLFAKYAKKYSIPVHEGDKINLRRFGSVTPTTDASGNIRALTEGTVPAETSIAVAKVEATVSQYGDYIKTTDKLDMVGIDPFVTETAVSMGESAGLAIDTVLRDIVCAGTNVQYANGRANADAIVATDIMNSTEIKKAVRTLRKANAKPVEGKYFIMFADPDICYDLQSDSLWQDVSKYNGGEAIVEGEIGKICGVKVVSTTNLKVVANTSSVNVHKAMVIGKDAYGCVDVANGSTPEMIIKTSDGDTSNTSDPLNQLNTIGWKALFTGVRLDELSMVRIECGATA